MGAAFDFQLIFALAIVVLALALFGWHLISTTRDIGLMASESRVPRRYLVLGLAAGLGILYVTRR